MPQAHVLGCVTGCVHGRNDGIAGLECVAIMDGRPRNAPTGVALGTRHLEESHARHPLANGDGARCMIGMSMRDYDLGELVAAQCRSDGVDPGVWRSVDPSRLVIPLDTHVARIARYVGLLRRKSADWRAALELTAELRAMDAADPVRYDYALCRLGIIGTCPRRRERRKCDACPLFEVCLL